MIPKFAEFLVWLVIFLYLFFALFLFFYREGNRTTKNILGSFFLVLAIAILDVFFQFNKMYVSHPNYAFIANGTPFLYGPLIWLFSKSIIERGFRFTKKHLIHFIPFALISIFFLLSYHLRDLDFKQEFLRRANDLTLTQSLLIAFVLFTMIGTYIFKSHQLLDRYRLNIRKKVSNVDRINLDWLELTLWGFTVTMLFLFLVQVLLPFVSADMGNTLLFFTLIILFLFIIRIIIKGLEANITFSSLLEDENKVTSPVSSNLEIDLVKLEEIDNYMSQQKPFLNPSLSINELATMLNLSQRELSFLINKGKGKNFFDFINEHRIQFARDQIKNSKDAKLTISEVMYSVGFNSKSSFNTAFKKHSGMTPSQWKSRK